METTKLANWLNLLASFGVLVGLLLVAYEVRQTNRMAFAEFRTGAVSAYYEVSSAAFGPEITGIYMKSIQTPGQLTDEELFKLSEWYAAIMVTVGINANLHYEFGWADDPTEDIKSVANFYFNSPFSRYWWENSRSWMSPNLVEIMDRALAASPVATSWKFADGYKTQFPNTMPDIESDEP